MERLIFDDRRAFTGDLWIAGTDHAFNCPKQGALIIGTGRPENPLLKVPGTVWVLIQSEADREIALSQMAELVQRIVRSVQYNRQQMACKFAMKGCDKITDGAMRSGAPLKNQP